MKKKILVVAGLLAMSGALTAQSVYPGQHAGKLKRNRGSDESQEF